MVFSCTGNKAGSNAEDLMKEKGSGQERQLNICHGEKKKEIKIQVEIPDREIWKAQTTQWGGEADSGSSFIKQRMVKISVMQQGTFN